MNTSVYRGLQDSETSRLDSCSGSGSEFVDRFDSSWQLAYSMHEMCFCVFICTCEGIHVSVCVCVCVRACLWLVRVVNQPVDMFACAHVFARV
jgi:hypothetical protein